MGRNPMETEFRNESSFDFSIYSQPPPQNWHGDPLCSFCFENWNWRFLEFCLNDLEWLKRIFGYLAGDFEVCMPQNYYYFYTDVGCELTISFLDVWQESLKFECLNIYYYYYFFFINCVIFFLILQHMLIFGN